MNNVRNWPTPKLLSFLPHASGVLREQVEAQLKVRFAGTQIKPMPCLKLTSRDQARALKFAPGRYRATQDGEGEVL